ncbi:secretion protein HlyD [Rothia sp. P6271]|uniref:secretion protein HlyD n=1 Tax=Rothia sp. P6271 TaxID=3402659 RepID=UPI003AD6CF9E
MTATKTSKLWVILLVVILCAITIGSLILAMSFKTTAQKAAEAAAPPPSTVTAEVTKERLRTVTDVICTPGYSGTTNLQPRNIAPNGQYTNIDIVQDEVLRQGSHLADINGSPVIALIGGFSLYRDLHLEDSGPDAELLNNNLQELGLMGNQGATITAETYRALNALYAGFGYPPLKNEDTIPVSGFIVLSEPSTVISAPRSTGDAQTEPLARIAAGTKELLCTGPSGELTPEAQDGQKILFPAFSNTEYTARLTTPTQQQNTDNAPEQALPHNEGTPPVINAPQEKKKLVLNIPEELSANEGTVRGVLVLQEAPEDQLVVPTSAIFNRNGTDKITLVKGDSEEEIPIQVIFSAEGKSAITAQGHELAPGEHVKIPVGA